MIEQFHNLRKLYVYTSGLNTLIDFIVPQVRHYIFEGSPILNQLKYSELYELSCICPNLETFELKCKISRSINRTSDRLKFHNLKTFTFTYDSSAAKLYELQAIFYWTNTKSVPEIDDSEVENYSLLTNV